MDGHAMLEAIALFSTGSDGGPRGYRRRGKKPPEHYLPGRFLMGMRAETRIAVVRAVNSGTPAPWFLRSIVDEEEPRVAVPPPPVDRRWSCRGRWSTPPTT